MSSHLNNRNNNGNKNRPAKGPLRDFLSKSNARSQAAMKAPIKHVPQSETTYVWQEGDGSKDVGWDANGSPSVAYDEDSIKGVSRHNKNTAKKKLHGKLHDWSDDILTLTCKYCESSPCECNMSNIDI